MIEKKVNQNIFSLFLWVESGNSLWKDISMHKEIYYGLI